MLWEFTHSERAEGRTGVIPRLKGQGPSGAFCTDGMDWCTQLSFYNFLFLDTSTQELWINPKCESVKAEVRSGLLLTQVLRLQSVFSMSSCPLLSPLSLTAWNTLWGWDWPWGLHKRHRGWDSGKPWRPKPVWRWRARRGSDYTKEENDRQGRWPTGTQINALPNRVQSMWNTAIFQMKGDHVFS